MIIKYRSFLYFIVVLTFIFVSKKQFMFFVLSKLLVFLLYPFTWIIIFLILSLLLKNNRWKKRSLILALFIAIIFSNIVIFNKSTNWWEVDSKRIDQLTNAPYDVGILLGGIGYYDASAKKIVPRSAADRLIQTVKLYKLGIIKKVFITSGAPGVFIKDLKPEAEFLRDYLIDVGVPAKDIIIENKSRNTHENAIYSYKIFKEKGWLNKRILLITSGFHMRRAVACFHKAGFKHFDTFPVDQYAGKLVVDYYMLVTPRAEVLGYWNIFIKEWVGMIMYWLVGYI